MYRRARLRRCRNSFQPGRERLSNSRPTRCNRPENLDRSVAALKLRTMRSTLSMQTLHPAVRKIIPLLLAAVILSGCPATARKERILRRADHYFEAGQYDEAKIEYLN